MLSEADALQADHSVKMLMRFKVAIASLIWGITSLLFAVIWSEKTASELDSAAETPAF